MVESRRGLGHARNGRAAAVDCALTETAHYDSRGHNSSSTCNSYFYYYIGEGMSDRTIFGGAASWGAGSHSQQLGWRRRVARRTILPSRGYYSVRRCWLSGSLLRNTSEWITRRRTLGVFLPPERTNFTAIAMFCSSHVQWAALIETNNLSALYVSAKAGERSRTKEQSIDTPKREPRQRVEKEGSKVIGDIAICWRMDGGGW